jgi:plasmid stability protein
MPVQNLTLQVPDALYDQIKERAEQFKRSIEDETLELLAQSTAAVTLPDDLTAGVSHLDLLDDETLGRAARSHFATEAATELEALHLKQQCEQLTPAENESRVALIRQYERAMIIRAKAALLLRERRCGTIISVGVPWETSSWGRRQRGGQR